LTEFWLHLRLLAHLNGGRADGTLERRLKSYLKPDLLILDDFGLNPLQPPAPEDLYDVINERCEQGSIVLTSNLAHVMGVGHHDLVDQGSHEAVDGSNTASGLDHHNVARPEVLCSSCPKAGHGNSAGVQVPLLLPFLPADHQVVFVDVKD
jgi:hypothetical protein